jgi:hypothetical protein
MVYLRNISAFWVISNCFTSEEVPQKEGVMRNRLSKILIIAILLVLLLTACQSAEEGPAAAYWGYFESCENGKYESAGLFLDEEAKLQIESIGVCGFTHDAINRYEIERGGTERIFSEEPILDIDGNMAVMTWVDDQGKVAIVQLINTGDGWKIAQAVWSD